MWIPERVNKAGNVVPAFQIDECFADEVNRHSWTYRKDRYLRKRDGQVLHHFLWDLSGRARPRLIDHINGDRFDNRLENLRAANFLLNAKNSRRRKQSSSKLPRGVHKTSSGKFEARARHRDFYAYLGSYDTAEEASAVYQNAKEILIEFANLPGYENVIKGGVS